ncbi:thioredoxin domain-containing protein [Roseiconus lacunae]|nr:thioredoxin domain-containing protein [Roseiconus lacunae]
MRINARRVDAHNIVDAYQGGGANTEILQPQPERCAMSLADIYRPKLRNQPTGYHPMYGPIGGKKSAESGKEIFEYSANWWAMIGGSSIALVTSLYLAWASLTSSGVAGCGGDLFDCSNVLNSRWSSVLSVPVSIPAIVAHTTMIGLLVWTPTSLRGIRLRWTAIGVVAFAIAGAALWFIGLQFFWLQHLCPYCLAAHTAGLIVLAAYLTSGQTRRGLSKSVLVSVAALLVATMIGLQFSTAAPVTYEVIDYSVPAASDSNAGDTDAGEATSVEAAEESMLFEAPPLSLGETSHDHQVVALMMSFFSPVSLVAAEVTPSNDAAPTETVSKTARLLRNIKLDTSSWPLVGKPDAEMVFVEMFDYTCPHCQRTHQSLEQARKHFGDQLAVISLPVPLDKECNASVKTTHASHAEACELAKLAVAVWLADREQFESFHDYLFDEKPSYTQAITKARSMVDVEKLDATLRSATPGEYIAKHVTLYQRAGAGTIPKALFPESTVSGAIDSSQSFIQLIERHLR